LLDIKKKISVEVLFEKKVASKDMIVLGVRQWFSLLQLPLGVMFKVYCERR
jgi:hypothetical protein